MSELPPLPLLPTRVARAGWYDHRFFDAWVMAELPGRATLTSLFAMALSGKRLPPDAVGVLDDIAAVGMVADPRIWPLKVSRLVSAYGGMLPAFGASYVYFAGATTGPWPTGTAAAQFVDMMRVLGDRAADPNAVEAEMARRFATREKLFGWGVPFRDHDERLVVLRACIERRGRLHLPYWNLYETASVVARRMKHLEPNLVGGIASACLDMGLLPEQIAPLTTALLSANFLANAYEGAQQAPALLRRLPDERVRYVGTPPRESPRAQRARRDA